MDKAKKKRLKKYIAWVALAALVALLTVMPLLARSEQEAEGPVASILSATAEMGSIEVSLRGGGTLSAGTPETVKLPAGVKIREFLVKNGDLVAEGDPVAAVDKVSVMTAILEVRETLEYLQEEMRDAEDETVASRIRATAGGLVKQVFAQKGDDVADVMLRHGALAVLSLDGLMAVDLEVDTDYAAGDSVTVTIGEEEAAGRVRSNLDGTLVVTVEDADYQVGIPVTVSRKTGETLGEGALYVHNAWKATAFQGTVSTVSARENTQVGDGATLFTLTDTDFAGTLESLASLHREYEEELQELFAMHESGVITAPCGGEVSGVDQDSPFLLSAIAGEEGWFVDLLSNDAQKKGWTVMLLSNTEQPCTGSQDCQAEKHEEGCPQKCTGREGCTAGTHDPGCAVYCTGLSDCANLNHKTGCLGVCTGNTACQSTRPWEHHQKTCLKRCISDREEDPATACDALVHQDACIENCISGEECTALTHKEDCPFHGVTYTAMAMKVELAAIDGLKVIWGTTLYQVEPKGEGWALVNPSQLQDLFLDQSQLLAVPDPTAYASGDILLMVNYVSGEGTVFDQKLVLFQKGQGQDPGGTGGFPGGFPGFDFSGLLGGLGGMAGMMGGFGTATEFELYDLEGDPLLTVTPRDTATLSIALDETDIASAALGKTAQVKVNALRGAVFEALVTDISGSGANNGGSSKFAVELTLPMEERMIPGMSATAVIPLYTKMEVLTIPVAAVNEAEGKTLVYTALDEKTGEPCSPVEVELGISDGTKAEVLSGLEKGQSCYYSYYDTLELSTEAKKEISFGG